MEKPADVAEPIDDVIEDFEEVEDFADIGDSSDWGEVEAEAPPRPRRARNPERSSGKKQAGLKPREDAAGAKRLPIILAAVGGGSALLILLLVVALVWVFSGDGDDPPTVTGEAPAVEFDADRFAVIEAPIPLEELPDDPQPEPPAVVEVEASADAATTGPDAAEDAPTAAVAEPLWELPVDSPERDPEPIADEFQLVLERGYLEGVPTLAALDGPFVLGTPERIEQRPAQAAPPPEQRRRTPRRTRRSPGRTTPDNTPETSEPDPPARQPDWLTPLIDMRTGETAGSFLAVRDTTMSQRLSPQGEFLVTRGRLGVTTMDDRTEREGILYSWTPNAPEPLAEITMPGFVGWIEFVSNERIAMFAAEPEPVLQVSDVTTGEVVHSIRLEQNEFLPVSLPTSLEQHRDLLSYAFVPTTNPVAVSPTGRYVAISGREGITVVDSIEGREIGLLPIPQTSPNWPIPTQLDFSPDGTQLYVLTVHPHSQTGVDGVFLMVWDFASGRLLSDTRVEGSQGNIPKPGRLLAGPEDGTYVRDSDVTDAFAGQIVYTFPFQPLRWCGPDRLLGLVVQNIGGGVLETYSFDRADYTAKATAARIPVQRRPGVMEADRSAIVAAAAQPPATWRHPPTTDVIAEPPDQWGLMQKWPTALGDDVGVLLNYAWTMDPIEGIGVRGRARLVAQRIDLITGDPVGEPAMLWPWIAIPERHYTSETGRTSPPIAALTADATRLAVRDPADQARVDFWAEDFTRIGGFKPFGETPIDWLGWSAEGKLLARGGGMLTAWDSDNAKALYEVADGYSGPIAYSPGRAWLALVGEQGIDIIDTESGECLARCLGPNDHKPYLEIAVAPDGRSLAAARFEVNGPPPGQRREPTDYVADIWDLSSGAMVSVPFGQEPVQPLHWISPRHLLAAGGMYITAIDSTAGEAVWTGNLPSFLYSGHMSAGDTYINSTPDGRLWVLVKHQINDPDLNEREVWITQNIPDRDAPDVQRALADNREYQSIADALRIEVDAGEMAQSEAAARRIAGRLQQRGFTIAPGGWTLRVSHEVVDTDETLTAGAFQATVIPALEFTWQLIGPEGTVGWETKSTTTWNEQSSRYYTGSSMPRPTSAGVGPVATERTLNFDFQDRNVREAILEEIHERAGQFLGVPDDLPGRLVTSGGVREELPPTEEIDLDYGLR